MFGGDAAKLVGKAAHRALKQWRPNLERDLLAKASDAVVKAADTLFKAETTLTMVKFPRPSIIPRVVITGMQSLNS